MAKRQAIYFQHSGILAMIPPDGNPGTAFPPERFTNGELVKIDIADELIEHVDRQHCAFQDGKVNLKPENKWIENKPIEELNPLEQRWLAMQEEMKRIGLTDDDMVKKYGTAAREVL